MTDSTSAADARDYRDTVFLPQTAFPMKAGLPQKEPGILAKWEADGLYQQLRAARAGREKFILHDGPPYANGDMHIGHALNHILKDMVCRTQTLLGKDAPYVPGWDCHGLPIEWKVEEQYRKKKLNKDEVPVKEFRAECRAYAQHWVNVQREQVKRLGVLGNWDMPYLTMDFDSEATIVSELLKFAESGQLYRGAKPVMWSPVEKTALAEAEVEYEDITSTQIDVAFEIVEAPYSRDITTMIERGGRVLAIVWTTTPWTIPVNQALAYNPSESYQMVRLALDWTPEFNGDWPENELHERLRRHGWKIHNDAYLVAEELCDQFLVRVNKMIGQIDFTDLTKHPVRLKSDFDYSVSGGELIKIDGLDLTDAFARHPMASLFRHPGPRAGVPLDDGAQASGTPGQARGDGEGSAYIDPASPLAEFFLRPRPFLPGDFVTTDSGTGLVHMAPDHGEDDFDLCKAHGIEPVFAVEGDGKYRADWAWLGGQGSVINPKFNAPDGPICSDLRAAGALLAASADYQHSYPHSWRSKAKVIYRCTPQWFVPMDKPIESEPYKTVRAEPVEALSLPDRADKDSPSTRSGRTELGHGQGIPATLRELAMAAIADTRFVPEKGRNRIGSMVEGRPDWVLSRQRAWGVPITLFVDRKTGQYLNDASVNARIVAGVKAEGVDAWEASRAQDYLGSAYRTEDYEQVFDILDVWFDSGCTHVFTLESGKWPELSWPADLYLEGSDQHRGWFQSSLLQSCGTRGRAPYDAVLTHGFTMDAKGMKMSKSVGNTVDPLKVMETNGADIIRLWALSVDFTEDHRIGDEILKGVADQYRKLRNTFRYLLGALEGFGEDERVAVADMPELERYMLHLLAEMDGKLRAAVQDFDFNSYVRLLADFANEDLSAFFFDIRKDCLYCDVNPATGWQSDKRRAYRTVLDVMFHALVRYAAPVLVFTAEEVWGTRYPDGGSVHLLEWPELPVLNDADILHRHSREGGNPTDDGADTNTNQMDPRLRGGDELVEKWTKIREFRSDVLGRIELLRRDKLIGSSLEVEITIETTENSSAFENIDFSEICIVAASSERGVEMIDVKKVGEFQIMRPDFSGELTMVPRKPWVAMGVSKTTHHKCGRCWRHLPEVAEDGGLCNRCDTVLSAS